MPVVYCKLSKKYEIAKKFRIAHKEIGHETDLFFHLPEEVFEICHQHKVIRVYATF